MENVKREQADKGKITIILLFKMMMGFGVFIGL